MSLIFSEDVAYDIKMIFWNLKQNQETFYFIGFFHKIDAAAQITYLYDLGANYFCELLLCFDALFFVWFKNL